MYRQFIENIRTYIKIKELNKVQRIAGLLLILGAIAYLGWLIYKQRSVLLAFHWEFQLPYLLLFAFFHSLAMLAQSLSWHLAMTSFTGIRRFKLDFSVYTISLVSRRIPSPISIWYIGSRYALYPSEIVSPKIITILTGLELGLIGLAGVICYTIFLPFYSFAYNWPWQAILAGGFLAVVILVIRPGIMIDFTNLLLKLLKRAPIQATISRKDLLVWTLCYVLTWILDGISLYYWIAAIIPNPPRLMDIIGVSTISSLVSYVSQFLPAGFALKEISMSALLGIWIPVSVAAVVAIGYRLVMIIVEILLAILFRASLSPKNQAEITQ